jgi:hypothetical protein
MTPVRMPTLDELAAAEFAPTTPRYPPVSIDGVLYTGLCDPLIDLVEDWAEQREAVKAQCRAVAAAAAQGALVDEAKARLAETDHWVLKAIESGQPLAPARIAYRDALRAIVNAPADFTAWPAPP